MDEELVLAVRKAYFRWEPFSSVGPRVADLLDSRDDAACDALQRRLTEELLSYKLAKFPVDPEFKVKFLKRLVVALEGKVKEVAGELYSAALEEQGDQEEVRFHYKTYFVGDDAVSVSLAESRSLVGDGTTGLRTWEAAEVLLEHLVRHPEDVGDGGVLELGSGVGLLGIALAKLGLASKGGMVLSDCHHRVLEALRHNCQANLGKDVRGCSVVELDWTSFDASAAATLLREHDVSTVLASDVVFDPGLVPHLANVLALLLTNRERPADRALVACTVRQEETLELFERELVAHGLRFDMAVARREGKGGGEVRIYKVDVDAQKSRGINLH